MLELYCYGQAQKVIYLFGEFRYSTPQGDVGLDNLFVPSEATQVCGRPIVENVC